jgi:hypothetical protein
MRLTLATLVLLTPLLSAQTLVTVPTSIASDVNRPFAGGTGHYQQWHAAWSLQSGFATPVRIDQIEFFAGSSNTATAYTIDMQVEIAHGNNSGLTGIFGSNYNDTPLVIRPRGNLVLNAGAPGAVVMTIPFATQFTWDRTRPIVIDIKIFGNSNSSQPFVYNNRGTASGISEIHRLYAAGSPNAVNGTPQQWVGMVTRFRGRDGVVLEYGTGCPGEGGFVPNNEVLNLPWPGIAWSHRVAGAASQRFCLWMIGDNRQSAGTVALPVDIGAYLGGWTTGCMLRQNAVATLGAMTVGSGPGAGIATVTLNLPPVTSYIGWSLYTQWFVLDPNAPSGLLSATEAAWTIVAPIGG